MIERGVVMTDLKMFSKPVVFTDFDGVLNAPFRMTSFCAGAA